MSSNKETITSPNTSTHFANGRRKNGYGSRRIRVGLSITLLGFLIFMLGVKPALFGVDRSPVIGFVQIATMLVGLAFICVGGYLSLASLWPKGATSIGADIGLRLVSTGYVLCVFTGIADIFGLGSQTLPDTPYFGPWQAYGVELGILVIIVGFILLIPPRRSKEPGSRATSANR
ncbi:MAG: hypothetical protein JW704_09695 [Anaerolineaceae bacterium]|nr:hypothetical protein [Anaerolineaceae bacterium]